MGFDASWVVWVVSALLVLAAVVFTGGVPFGRDFRTVAVGAAILAHAAAAARPDWRVHLLWFTPVMLVGVYLYSLRRLFWLSHRLNQLNNAGMSPDEIQRTIQKEVEEFNSKARSDDERMK